VFPTVPVDKKTNKYYKYKREDFYRDEMRKRAPGTKAAEAGYDQETDDYVCETYALRKTVSDEVAANTDTPLNAKIDASQFLTHKLLIGRERLWASEFFKTSVWGKDYTGVASSPNSSQVIFWDDYSNSDPIGDLERAIERVATTGHMANKLVLGRPAWRILKQHPDFVDRVKYGQTAGAPATVSPQALAAILGIEEVIIANSVYNAAVKGATEDLQFIFGRSALLVHAAKSPGIQMPSAGYVFAWKGMEGVNGEGFRVKAYRWEEDEGDRIECSYYFDMKKVAGELGVFFSNVVQAS